MPCRDQILLDLAILARGSSRDEAPEVRDWVEQQIHDAVAHGLPLYLSLLRASDPRVRRYVPFVLDVLPECAPAISFVLESHLLQETDPQVKAHLLFYLSDQPDYRKADDQWLRDWADAVGEHPFVRTVAAMLHLRRAKEQTPFETVQVLLKTLINSEMVEDLYQGVRDFLPLTIKTKNIGTRFERKLWLAVSVLMGIIEFSKDPVDDSFAHFTPIYF